MNDLKSMGEDPAGAASEAVFKRIVENLGELVVRLSAGGELLYISPNYCQVFGKSREELIGRSFMPMIHPDDRDGVERSLARLGHPPHRTRHRDRAMTADGWRWFEWSVRGVVGEDGELSEMVAIGRDIHDLKESEQQLEAIFEMSLDPICIASIDTATFLKVNPAFERILGYSPTELLDRPFLDFVHPDDLDRTVSVIDEQLKKGQLVLTFMNRYRCKDGSYRYFDWNSHPVPEEGVTYAIARDVTSKIEAEEALSRSDNMYRALVSHMSSGVAVYTAVDGGENFAFADFNKHAETLSGFDRDRLIGMLVTEAFPAVEEFGLLDVLRRVWRSGEAEQFPQRVYSDDRVVGWFDNYVYKLPSGEVVAVFDDVTTREEAMAQQRSLEAQLRHSQKMEAIGRLAGGVAHDFNNLLTGISCNVSLAGMDLPMNDPVRATLHDVSEAVDRAADLTRQLLTFSSRQIIKPRLLDLSDVVRGLAKMLGRIIGEHIELEIKSEDVPILVSADQGQLEQAIVNLAVNSRDAMPDGGRIEISTGVEELERGASSLVPEMEPGRYASISVLDTGQGIDGDILEKIFDPFFTTKPMGVGTGLGLSIVFGSAKQHGGTVLVESEPGVGTEVRLLLPVAKGEVTEPELDVVSEEIPEGNETILLVEDDPVVRRMATRILTRQGYAVLSACDGNDALEIAALREQPADLLLTDVIMPKRDGLQLFRELKKRWPDVKVLFTSGYPEEVISNRGVLDEGVNFIPKPYDPKGLSEKVRQVLDE